MDSHSSSFELALLEGMSDKLLLALKQHGISTRAELQAGIETPQARKALARATDVPELTLEALFELNFVLPEERVTRRLQQERFVTARLANIKQSLHLLRVLAITAVILSLAVSGWVVLGPRQAAVESGDSAGSTQALFDSVAAMQAQLDRLRPLVREQNRVRLAAALELLTPAPGWHGPLEWSAEDHQSVTWSLEQEPKLRALSLALGRLASLEDPEDWARSPHQKAQEAAEWVREFPPLNDPQDAWDLAAATLRLRLASRTAGGAPVNDQDIGVLVTQGGFWAGHPFAPCEALLLNMESLPLREGAQGPWLDALYELLHQANLARDRLGDSPKAWAREYWTLRAELECALVLALINQGDMERYSALKAEAFLNQRTEYLERALSRCPAEARGALSWLRVEFLEGARLVQWMRTHSNQAGTVRGLPWGETLEQLEGLRTPSPSPELEGLVQRALEAEGYTFQSAAAHPRTRWEAGLRPLLMETRVLASRPFEDDSSPAP